jgi:allophanate hydrolase
MKAGLRVRSPGFHTTIQDLGRPGWQAIGVPVSGALDAVNLRLANALVGNPAGAPALELLFSGPELEVAADTVRVALAGAGARLATGAASLPSVPAGLSVTLLRGDVLKVIVGGQSSCCYLAVEGGFAVAPVLGSASTYVRAGIGGLEGRALLCGDFLSLTIARATERRELRLPSSPPTGDQSIRVVLGPQQEYFTEAAIAALLGSDFRVSQSADRMGMRLNGPLLHHRSGWDIVSDAIATGAIQVPGSGQPIVLLADHQTTGGYPKIATVISADLSLVARRRPGDVIRFAAVTIEAAEALCRAEERRITELVAALQPAQSRSGVDLLSLYDGNLISGVVSGVE